MMRHDHVINGKTYRPEFGSYFPTTEPFSGEAWAEIARGSDADVDLAIESSEKAFLSNEWKDNGKLIAAMSGSREILTGKAFATWLRARK